MKGFIEVSAPIYAAFLIVVVVLDNSTLYAVYVAIGALIVSLLLLHALWGALRWVFCRVRKQKG